MKNILVISTFLFSSLALSHTKNKPPIDAIQSTGNDRPVNHSGYGYLNTSSEAEAQDKVNFVCPKKEQIKELDGPCNPNDLAKFSKVENLESTFHAMNRHAFDQKMRDQVYEFITLQKAASNSERPVKIKRPSCISNTGIESQLPELKGAEWERAEEIKSMAKHRRFNSNETLRKKRDWAVKLNSIKSNRSSNKLVQAVMLNDQYKNVAEQNDCSSTTTEWQIQLCASITEYHDKLKMSFPAIFRQPEFLEKAKSASSYIPINMDDAINKASSFSDTMPKVNQIREKAYLLIGSDGVDPSMSKEDRIARGKRLYDTGVEDQYGIGWDDNSPDKLFKKAFDRGRYGDYDPEKGSFTPNPAAKKTYKELDQFAEETLDKYDNALDAELAQLCGDGKLSSKDLVNSYPQVVRQLLLDADPTNFELAKNYMCKENLDGIVQKGAGNSCAGVSGDISDKKGMTISRYEYSFPFGGPKNYSIKKVGDELVVKTKINFKFMYDPTLPESKADQKAIFDKKIAKWETDSNNFYSSLKSKMTPSVKLEFEAGTGSEDPVVKVSKCYNRELPEEVQHQCASVNAAGGNWEDAGSFTFDMDAKTLNHEMGHQLGLDDEYTADYYPINSLGEDDSVMNSGVNLYPRHLRRIVQPALRCGKTTREELTPRLKK
jgi:hypothetical protein